MIRLYRVAYGKKDTPEHMREYRREGVGSVGCISEWKTHFPNETFQIIDKISGDEDGQ